MKALTEDQWENQTLFEQAEELHRYLTDHPQSVVPDGRVNLLGRTLERMKEDGSVTSEANLGLATTKELLEELQARAELGGYDGYRTVDG